MDSGKETIPGSKGESSKNFPGRENIHKLIQSMATSSKWLFTLAVIGTMIISAVLFIYGFLITLAELYRSIIGFNLEIASAKNYMETAIQIVDIFLVGTVFYLISLGLYELFIAKAPLPGWSQIKNLDDLKEKLLGLTVIAISVVFLGTALNLSPNTSFIEIGVSVGIMIAAISFYLWAKK